MTHYIFLASLILFSPWLLAREEVKDAEIEAAARLAESKMKATFTGMSFTSFNPSPIKGLFEVHTGEQIIYFHPESEALFFGEIFNKHGVSLTQESIKRIQSDNKNSLPLESALYIGYPNAKKTIIEFTSPSCGYCKSYERWLEQHHKDKVNRYVFFDTRNARQKTKKLALHILCSIDQKKTMDSVYLQSSTPLAYTRCDKGERLLKEHNKAASRVGVKGTPSFLIDNHVVFGFQKNELNSFFNRNK